MAETKRRETMSFISSIGSIAKSAATRIKNLKALLLIWAVQLVGASAGSADPAPKPDSSDEARIAALAKQWFIDMQQGKVDRSLYAPAYAAQITDGAVQVMSGSLNRYGAEPLRCGNSENPEDRRTGLLCRKICVPARGSHGADVWIRRVGEDCRRRSRKRNGRLALSGHCPRQSTVCWSNDQTGACLRE